MTYCPLDADKLALQVSEKKGEHTVGFGIGLLYDSRDFALNATRGWYFSGNMLFNQKCWGSNFNYTQMALDFRHFRRIAASSILGVQFIFQTNTVNVPFWQTASLDSRSILRGL
ncbi:BamA/TamA family outer membrane protein [Hydrotalea flava]|uniref:BamA/TamA family outer membrane protein n=1 Tax=Hydrotalea flava TaxID=714549 RepID=UPI00142EF98D|nr:BamA/TamA family outer membrane protein [Hydrotalea flava]